MKNKYTLLAIATAFVIMPVFAIVQAAPGTGESVTSADAGTPSTGGSTSSANNTVAPSTGGSISSANNTVAPATGNSDSSAGATAAVVVTPPASTGGGSYSPAGGSSVFITNCSPIVSFMRLGINNNISDVKNLQSFLRNTQELDVDVTGIFDQKTENAVKAFQTKYASNILSPWGATVPTGIAGITTIKKINELSCKTPLTLNASELATINAYKNGHVSVGTNVVGSVDQGVIVSASVTPSPSVNADQSENTATVINPSIFQRFWGFMKSLF